MIAPVGNIPVTSPGQRFGAPRDGGSRPHKGRDYSVRVGTPVQAADSGTATEGYSGGMGKYVTITHGSGCKTVYGHLSQIIKLGRVNAGDVIALSGNTGKNYKGEGYSAHLHFEIWADGQAQDPDTYMYGSSQVQGDDLTSLLSDPELQRAIQALSQTLYS